MVSQCLSGKGKHYRWMCMASGGLSGYVLQSSQLCGPGKTHFREREPVVLSYRTFRLLTRFYVRTTTGQPSRYVPEKKKKNCPTPRKQIVIFCLLRWFSLAKCQKLYTGTCSPEYRSFIDTAVHSTWAGLLESELSAMRLTSRGYIYATARAYLRSSSQGVKVGEFNKKVVKAEVSPRNWLFHPVFQESS